MYADWSGLSVCLTVKTAVITLPLSDVTCYTDTSETAIIRQWKTGGGGGGRTRGRIRGRRKKKKNEEKEVEGEEE
jgi:hypothetical protein